MRLSLPFLPSWSARSARPNQPARPRLPEAAWLRLLAGPAGLAVVAGLSVVLALLLLGAAGDSMAGAGAALVLLVMVLALAAAGSVRRFLIFGFFLTAAIDLNKAVAPPVWHFYSPGLYVTVAQALLLVWTLYWLFERLALQRQRLPFTRVDAWALAYLAVVWWGTLRSPMGGMAYASAIGYSLCVLAFYVVSHALTSLDDVRLAFKGLIVTFGLQAFFVALQTAARHTIVLPGIKTTELAGQAAMGGLEAYRPVGLFNHPNVMADYALWMLLPALALVMLGRRRVAERAWWVALVVFVVSAGMLLLSLSRGGWASALLGGLVLGAVYFRVGLIGSAQVRRVLLLAVVGAVLAVAVYPELITRLTGPDGRSVESRLLLQDQALMLIREKPWMGVGFAAYNQAAYDHLPASWAMISEDYRKALLYLVVHNQYLLTAAELGIPAMLLWVLLLVQFARQAWPLSQWRQPGLFALGTGLGAAVIGHMLYLSSDNYYADIRIFFLWMAAGLLQALTLQARRSASAPAQRAERA
jgi:O-antigen ligase